MAILEKSSYLASPLLKLSRIVCLVMIAVPVSRPIERDKLQKDNCETNFVYHHVLFEPAVLLEQLNIIHLNL